MAKKKNTVQKRKRKHAKNSEDRLTALGKKTQSCERQISNKRSKEDDEASLPARVSMKRPLTPFFPLPQRPSLRNTRLSESRASIKIKIVALDVRVYNIFMRQRTANALSPGLHHTHILLVFVSLQFRPKKDWTWSHE